MPNVVPTITRFEEAVRRFDEANSRDPNLVTDEGKTLPRELLHAQWLTGWVARLCPGASEALRLAARGHHLCRWEIPRETFPPTREGYLRWRHQLKLFHSQKSEAILCEVGYPPEILARVQDLNLKKNFPADPECRILEDALCLVFLEHQFGPLASKSTEEKMLNALRKTWQKMTPAARQIALGLKFSPLEKALIQKAGLSSPQ
jgi:hypothetical protein